MVKPIDAGAPIYEALVAALHGEQEPPTVPDIELPDCCPGWPEVEHDQLGERLFGAES